MENFMINSRYYKFWDSHTDVAKSTKKSYRASLRKFDAFLTKLHFEAPLDLDSFYIYNDGTHAPIDKEFVDSFIEYLHDQNLSNNAKYSTLSAIKSIFCFLEDYELIKNNPFRNYPNGFKEWKILDRGLSIKECNALLNSAKSLDSNSDKYLCLLTLLLFCGLRAREVCELEYSQIYFDVSSISIHNGQKTKAMGVPMNKAVVKLLKRYTSSHEWSEWSARGGKTIFYENNKPLTYVKLLKWIEDIVENSSVVRRITPHMFRHTFAQMLLKNGEDLITIKRMLRHKSVTTTLMYLGPLVEWNEEVDHKKWNKSGKA
ncbi:tyrosine-type recombinase/integrase [Alkalihalobacillus sp. R86527]|uniref:tyrosine-type recombinase/integrase n=1 Tax=Alkalihalobacillus sp. R86527 TaxID=3093863 RepID=UPI0036700ED6